ncbi:MAG: hypothetical protein DRJ67_12440 [Thermoprotei archaeon]|nr:MAG: hypothetical protein DRJ67_12440 [Thermoprotei archaeon]
MRGIWTLEAVAAVKARSRRLAEVLGEYDEVLRRLGDGVYRATSEAWEEAVREAGVRPGAVPSIFRPVVTILARSPLASLAHAVKVGAADNKYVHEFLLDTVDNSSYDQGRVNMLQEMEVVANPRVLEKYRPVMKTALAEPSEILFHVKEAIARALRRCATLIESDEYQECLADELERELPRIKDLIERVDWDAIREEVKEVYAAVLEHGKERGLERAFY